MIYDMERLLSCTGLDRIRKSGIGLSTLLWLDIKCLEVS